MTFAEELSRLCDQHKIHLSGTLRIVELDETWDAASRAVSVEQAVMRGDIPDKTGPFLVASIARVPVEAVEINPSARIHISSDIVGYDCPISGKWIDGRRDHRENLSRTGCRNLEPGESRDSQQNQQRDLAEGCKRTAREMVAAIAHQIEV